MGRIINAYILPHPPIVIPEVGRGGEIGAKKTIEAYKRVAKDIKNDNPDIIVLITPHGPFFRDLIYITDTGKILEGDFGRYGASKVKLRFENHLDLARAISDNAMSNNIQTGGPSNSYIRRLGIPKTLDHGTTVPLYFIEKEGINPKLVHISVADMPYITLFEFGKCINKSISEIDEDVVIIASADLSHSLTQDAPCGYNKMGEVFDKALIDYLTKGDVSSILNFDKRLVQEASECGLRPIIMMLGAIEEHKMHTQIYSYEGPFGVGYMVSKIGLERIEENSYVSLARLALEAYIKDGITIDIPKAIPKEMIAEKAGIFVTIKKQGSLRGCIGTIFPVRENIAEEIVCNAISAGTRDPRFPSISLKELDHLTYSVDVIGKPQFIESALDLDPQKYGVIVRAGSRSGLLLPDIEGVDTREEQVAIALKKAGISPNEDYEMERFEVIRHV